MQHQRGFFFTNTLGRDELLRAFGSSLGVLNAVSTIIKTIL